jgi:hypothetical protein
MLNNNVEWKCGQMIKLLNIHRNDQMQMDYDIGFQFILDVGHDEKVCSSSIIPSVIKWRF